ncbi:MAG: Trk system potassium transporter TrkA [Alphaproteobacteria bacterium]|nr:Trk system potassium transporter TrkA [Alphaproteobacteria bacterium]
MKFIIYGAGQVGRTISKYLSDEKHQVVLIDENKEILDELSSKMDIQTIVGAAVDPSILEEAEAQSADMLISVTRNDERNMMACVEAHTLFNVPFNICRVQSDFYRGPQLEKMQKSLAVNVMISTEQEVAKSIFRNLKIPSALDLIPFDKEKISFLGLKCLQNAPLAGIKLEDFHEVIPDFSVAVACVVRGEEIIYPSADLYLMPDDEVYFMVENRYVRRILELLGHERNTARKLVIFGGGCKVGMTFAQLLEDSDFDGHVTFIEKNEKEALCLAEKLKDVLVINGDGLSEDILSEVHVDTADVTVALSEDDEENILFSLIAKKKGVSKSFALIQKPLYNSLTSELGLDVAVDPNVVVIATILRYIQKGRIMAVYPLRSGLGELMEVEALSTSKITGRPLGEIKMPDGVWVVGILRDNRLVIGTSDLVINAGDIVFCLAKNGKTKDVEALFSAGLFFF